MDKSIIVVIGTSAGGLDALKTIVADFDVPFNAAIFIVWHMPPNSIGILSTVLTKSGKLGAAYAKDSEPIENGRIYIAPPDHHMVIEGGFVRISHGPKENLFRPAIDPLFRSAAFEYGNRSIGVILTGGLDDGTAGLWAIKQCGGVAIVQDPKEAVAPGMPENALRVVSADYVLPVKEIGKLVVKLIEDDVLSWREESALKADTHEVKRELKMEVAIALGDGAASQTYFSSNELSPYTCPECHGVLAKVSGEKVDRFRCHTGHAYTTESLLSAMSDDIEKNLWSSARILEESMMMLNQLGDHMAESGQLNAAAHYFQKANDSEKHLRLLRSMLSEQQHFTTAITEKGLIIDHPEY